MITSQPFDLALCVHQERIGVKREERAHLDPSGAGDKMNDLSKERIPCEGTVDIQVRCE